MSIIYVYAQPTWTKPQAEISKKIETVFNDPHMSIEMAKRAAIDSHNVAVQSFTLLDKAVDLPLLFSAMAALLLMWLMPYMCKKPTARVHSNHAIDSDAGKRCELPGARHRGRYPAFEP